MTQLTLLYRTATSSNPWRATSQSDAHTLQVPDFRTLQRMILFGKEGSGAKIDRVVIDGGVSSTEFLTFLASLPAEFRADVLFVEPDDSAFLSAAAAGEPRVLYQLEKGDIEFYCAVHALRRDPPARLPPLAYQQAGWRK